MSKLKEQTQKPKALIMAGAGGAGKSYVLSQLKIPDSYKNYNPDKYIEDDGMSLGAASSKVAGEIKDAISRKESLVYDTTASNPNSIKEFLDAGYDVVMVMVYTHPIVSFLSNFERDRKIHASAVFKTWDTVYSLVDTYRDMLGSNFFLVDNTRGDKYKKFIELFNKAATKGARGVLELIDKITSADPNKFKNTFSKPFEIEDSEAKRSFEEETQDLNFDEKEEKNLKKYFMQSWDKKGVGPGEKRMASKLDSLRKESEKSKQSMINTMDAIADSVTGDKLEVLKSASSIDQVKSNIERFLNG